MYAAAQVLAQASKHGSKSKVPFMLSPGSTQIYETIKQDGILDTIVNAGATVLAASCGPCIGQWERKDIKEGEPNCIFTAFNRNFRGRNDANPETRAFLTSPPILAALAISGEVGFDPQADTLTGADGVEFKLAPPVPPPLPKKGLARDKGSFIPGSEDGENLEITINPSSDRLQLLVPFEKWDGKDLLDLPILIKTKGKTTTDHISPGGKWLDYRGHLTNVSENMLEGALNAFTGEVGHGTNVLTGEQNQKIPALAKIYKQETGGFVIVGDENYGEGSSREHAAMSPRFLGARAVVARSFARIHETNLKKQGILPLIFTTSGDYEKIEEYDRLSFVDLNNLRPGEEITCLVKKQEDTVLTIKLRHTLTEEQIEWFKAGSALNTIRKSRV
jgi:aconitate hydratase